MEITQMLGTILINKYKIKVSLPTPRGIQRE